MQVTPDGNASIIYIDPTGPLSGIGMGPDGNLYITNNTLGTILKISTSGLDVSVFDSGLLTPRNVFFDGKGIMYVPGYNGNLGASVINKISPNGSILIMDPDKSLNGWEIVLDTAGKVYEADHFSNVIPKNGCQG